MKIKGIDLKARPYDEETFTVLGQEVTFRAQVVTDYKEFEAAYPEPKAPTVTTPKKGQYRDTKDKDFLKKMQEYQEARMVYMVMQSLAVTEELEWDVLSLSDVSTLTLETLQDELTGAGFPEITAARIVNMATAANGLTQKMVDIARDTFLEEPNQTQKSEDSNE